MLEFTVPWPPSINHYWRHVGNKVLISKEGRDYRKKVAAVVASLGVEQLEGAVALKLRYFFPDWRRRDLDNLDKALLDAIGSAGLWQDDSFVVRRLSDKLRDLEGDGCVIVQIHQISQGVTVKKAGAWLD